MWYKGQEEKVKSTVRMLLKNGQLEIINGGWVANDEADTNYEDIINNMMLGL